MTGRDDGRKTEREADQPDDGRRVQEDGDDRDGWTPDAEKPQRKSDVTTDRPEGDVPEGGTGADGDFEPPLETCQFPLTTDELRKSYGEYRVDTDAGSKPLKELLEPADGETFGSADEVRGRIQKLSDGT